MVGSAEQSGEIHTSGNDTCLPSTLVVLVEHLVVCVCVDNNV